MRIHEAKGIKTREAHLVVRELSGAWPEYIIGNRHRRECCRCYCSDCNVCRSLQRRSHLCRKCRWTWKRIYGIFHTMVHDICYMFALEKSVKRQTHWLTQGSFAPWRWHNIIDRRWMRADVSI